MHIGHHHIVKARKKHKNKFTSTLIDHSVYVITIVAVLGNVPQLIKVWFEGNKSGVSVVTWAGFLFGSVFWLIYGLIHKEKPIIVANFFLILVQSFIVIGLIR